MNSKSRGLIAGCLAALALLVGCGSEDESKSSVSTTSEPDAIKLLGPNIVSPSEIAEQPEGSPGRALLEWWQAFQFRDAEEVISLTSQRIVRKLGKQELIDLVQGVGQGLQKVTVVSANEGGKSATVRGLLLNFPLGEDGQLPQKPTGSSPRTFLMTNEDGEWRFSDNEYLGELTKALPKK